MVQEPGDRRALGSRRLVEDVSTAELANGYLAAKARHCAPNTIRKCRRALLCLERVHPVLLRVSRDVIGFVQAEPLRASTRRVLYYTLQDFCRWIKANKDPLAPELPYVWFSRRRKRSGRKAKG